ncbi:MAG: cobyric acid synthase [Alphaproteobacteria bacterium]|nr:cobyric acid synthase [Alphaproteobacteria bacterium]
MIQGTGSNVGKSLLVAGLCRAFARRGLKVRPFKPQNMSNNAAVTPDGREIGRAQALQARAAGVAPSADMNPVLLKPEGERGAQIIVQGAVAGHASARDYQTLRRGLLRKVIESFERLAGEADLVLIEGAGSPAEVNLREGDIANMGFATAVDCPVVLVGDIERGGVIASLIGTVGLLEPNERRLLAGTIVNRFRGDPTLFADALPIIERETGVPCLGVVPHFAAARRLPAEDTLGMDSHASLAQRTPDAIRIAVPVLPRIANFDDLDPLKAEPDVVVELVRPGTPLPRDADLILLPGSKATRADLDAFIAAGWDIDLKAHVRAGGRVIGLCGGYQMLGQRIADPAGTEGAVGESVGLGLLDVETTLEDSKTLAPVAATDERSGQRVAGYEMHMGRTSGTDTDRPFLLLDGRAEGARSADSRVMGSYVHGLFNSDGFRHAFLASLKLHAQSSLAFEVSIEETLDGLADHLAASLKLERLLAIARRETADHA